MSIQEQPNLWVLETANTGYAFGFNASGMLTHTYWGKRLAYPIDYPRSPPPAVWASFNGAGHLLPEEYPSYGGDKYIEPCLKVTFDDGVRDLVLRFAAAEVAENRQELNLILQDNFYPLKVTLHYRVHEGCDLIERWVTIQNEGDRSLTVERLWSAQWHMPPGADYWLTHLSGRWYDEFNLCHERLLQGVKVLESRRLTTSHHHSPWFAVDRGGADEEQGEVWFGTLQWSGNWKIAAEVTDFQSTRINIGINDFDFSWTLTPGEVLKSPTTIAGYTSDGFGAASRLLHDFVRNHLLSHGHHPRKILYNSWEATLFNVDETSQMHLAEIAAQMGIELFVLDDGWYHKRNGDSAGLGDWWPDETKFPLGLKPLIETVNRLGMEFGLWLEPEMVNPDSDLYRAHPEWVIHFPNRASTLVKNQLILNLARPDVQEYLITTIDQLLSANPITFIKWDMNRNVSEPGWPDAPGDPREIWIRYVYGLYHVWQTLRDRHPDVSWQSCSGGGGRTDFGILQFADQIWASDNTHSPSRLRIQEGFTQLFPAKTMEAWVTDEAWAPDAGAHSQSPTSLLFRFHVSMCGVLGIGGHLLHWTDADRAQAADLIAQYKSFRHIILDGDLYRLRSAQQHGFSAVQYVSKDLSESVVLAYRTYLPHPAHIPPLYFRGLEVGRIYQSVDSGEQRSGSGWLYGGVYVHLGNFESQVIHLRSV